MKVSEYARKIGVTRATIYERFQKGKIKGAYLDENGKLIIPDDYVISFTCEENRGRVWEKIKEDGLLCHKDVTNAQELGQEIKNGATHIYYGDSGNVSSDYIEAVLLFRPEVVFILVK